MISNHNVLIVENDDNVLGILSRALQGEGYSVCPAHGGYESVALAFNTQFNVALIDTLIQPTGWVETVRQLNKISPRTKIILMTSYDMDSDLIHQVLNIDVQQIMSKPFHLEDLFYSINALCPDLQNVSRQLHEVMS